LQVTSPAPCFFVLAGLILAFLPLPKVVTTSPYLFLHYTLTFPHCWDLSPADPTPPAQLDPFFFFSAEPTRPSHALLINSRRFFNTFLPHSGAHLVLPPSSRLLQFTLSIDLPGSRHPSSYCTPDTPPPFRSQSPISFARRYYSLDPFVSFCW